MTIGDTKVVDTRGQVCYLLNLNIEIYRVMRVLTSPPSLLIETFKLAHTSPYGRFRVGSIIAQRKRILGYGINQKKTHPLAKKFASRPHLSSWLHAETHCITNCNAGELINSDVYVARVLMDGSWGNSRPCPGCHMALRYYGVRRMTYYVDGSFVTEEVA